MEETVIDLGDHLVAKIWHRRTASELEAVKTFYDAVTEGNAAFATPTIHQVLHLDGQFATVETLLRGKPLWIATDAAGSPALDGAAIAAVTDVLGHLAAIKPTSGMGVLPVLHGEAPFETPTMPFTRSLASLVERRVEKFHGPLSARLPTVDAVAAACVGRLDGLETGKPSLVHGDLIPANILVDDTSRPLAVLDFGFMTTIGDPAFDAAITASIYDMYGPLASKNEAILDEAVADRFGYDTKRLALYRAAFALITSNCFSVSGSDGHFEWCMRMLERPQVRDALEL
jgi:aminoglycoside phosphotransferase (APT) family kinase protein